MEYTKFAQVNGGLNDVSSVFCDLQMKALTKLHMQLFFEFTNEHPPGPQAGLAGSTLPVPSSSKPRINSEPRKLFTFSHLFPV